MATGGRFRWQLLVLCHRGYPDERGAWPAAMALPPGGLTGGHRACLAHALIVLVSLASRGGVGGQ